MLANRIKLPLFQAQVHYKLIAEIGYVVVVYIVIERVVLLFLYDKLFIAQIEMRVHIFTRAIIIY